MSSQDPSTLSALGALLVTGGGGARAAALAAPPVTAGAIPRRRSVGTGGLPARLDPARPRAHATTAWVGQALPVTVTSLLPGRGGRDARGARPRDRVQGDRHVTDLAGEPRQATDVIGGEPTLVATWTGTVTPSAPGPIDLSIDLPVQLRYREAAPRVALARSCGQDDPFAGLMGADPFDMCPSSIACRR